MGGCLSLGSQKPIEGEGLAIETIEGRMEDLGTADRMGCKGISSTSAIFEKCHRKCHIS
jgi:hypothetical protein